ncbi:MAG: RNA methyltransferase [Planctomycetota bacterium]
MNLKDAWLRAKAGAADTSGRFIAEGSLVVEQLSLSRFGAESVLGVSGRLDAIDETLHRFGPQVPVYEASRSVIEDITGFDLHRGLLAVGLREQEPPLEALLGAARGVVVLEGTSNHDNVGSVFRSVAALGGRDTPVILSPDSCDPLYRKSIRVSMGQVLHVPWTRAIDWMSTIERIQASGFEPIALTPAADAEPIEAVRMGLKRPPALFLGAEGPGLTEQVLNRCRRVRIPIDPRADSLNIAVSAAVALSWLLRAPEKVE